MGEIFDRLAAWAAQPEPEPELDGKTEFGNWGQLKEPQPQVVVKRFMDKIIVDDGHWMWQGGATGNYGVIMIDSKTKYAHRVSYELFNNNNEPMPPGHKVITCEIKFCVNPSHLSIAPIKTGPVRVAHPQSE
jgi:hypothetical protein